MTINQKPVGQHLIIALSGKLNDQIVEPELNILVDHHIEAFNGHLIFDCNGLEGVNSTGLNILLKILQIYQAAQRKVIIASANSSVEGVLKITQLDSVFGITENVETAVREIQQTTQEI